MCTDDQMQIDYLDSVIESLRSQLAASLKLQMDLAVDLEALGKKCTQLEADREYNAELVRERDVEHESLRSSNARLREALVEIRDNPNCHREISDEALRRFPDVSYHIITEARRQSNIAAKALEGK